MIKNTKRVRGMLDRFMSDEDRRVLAEAQQESQVGRSWQEWYQHVYLCSDEWAEKRERVLERDRGVCQGCLNRQATQVHHLTYCRVEIGNAHEMMFDLISLCDKCHSAIHGKEAQK